MDSSAQTSEPASSDAPAPTIEPAAPSILPELPRLAYSDSIAVEPRVLRTLGHPRRSVARRVTERLVLGVAALVFFAALIWSPNEAPTQVLRGTIGSPEEMPTGSSTAAIGAA